MLSKRSLLIVVGLVSILIIAATPFAKRTEVYFSMHQDAVTINPGEVGIFRWGWANCTYGLSYDWINATRQHYVVRKDGEVITEITVEQAAKPNNWTDPVVATYEMGGQPIREWCAWNATDVFVVRWLDNRLRFRDPGVYEIDVFMETTEALIDGFAAVTPPLDVYDAGVWYDKTVVVTVLE